MLTTIVEPDNVLTSFRHSYNVQRRFKYVQNMSRLDWDSFTFSQTNTHVWQKQKAMIQASKVFQIWCTNPTVQIHAFLGIYNIQNYGLKMFQRRFTIKFIVTKTNTMTEALSLNSWFKNLISDDVYQPARSLKYKKLYKVAY